MTSNPAVPVGHPSSSKIPLPYGEVGRLASELGIHLNTLKNRWDSGDPRVVLSVLMRQSELRYPFPAEALKVALTVSHTVSVGSFYGKD